MRYRSVYLSTVATAVALSSAAQAQDVASAGPTVSDKDIVVTGSRIRGAAPVGSAVISLDRKALETTGATTTTQLLQQLPQVFNLGVSDSSRGQAGGSQNITYGSGINLRGLGPYATLSLLDSHRVVQQGTSGQAFDPSVIPTLMLDRLEVVADGASATYGSDAVAGVANIILRRNYQGFTASARMGFADDYREQQFGGLFGHSWTGGQITLGYEYTYRSALNGANRAYFASDQRGRGGLDYRVTRCNPGNITIGGVSYAIPAGGVTGANQGALLPGTSNRCDVAHLQDLLPEQRRHSAALTFDQEITTGVKVYADAFAVRRNFAFMPAPGTATVTVPSSNAFYVAPAGLSPASETVDLSFAGLIPANRSTGFSEAISGTVGLTVDLGHNWKADLDYTYGADRDLSISTRGVNNAALTAALASSNPATAFDPYGAGRTSAATLAGISNTLFATPGLTHYQDFGAKFDGPLLRLPGGAVRVAVGYEGQRQTIDAGSDAGTVAAPVSSRVHLTRQVDSFFGEAIVPIFGSDNARPGLERLELSAAVRWDHYNLVGSTTNPKFGMTWEPVRGFKVHGSYGTSFRAPLPSQLIAVSQGLYVQNYSDPLTGGITQGLTLSGGNTRLKPETARTFSAGIDLDERLLHGFGASLNFFDVTYENQITSYLSDLSILQRESQFAGTGIINRNPSAATIASLLATYPVLAGTVPPTVSLYVDGRNNNLGRTLAQGFDFQLRYRHPVGNGELSASLAGTYYTKYKVAITAAAPLLDQLNLIYNPLRFRTRGSLGWSNARIETAAFINFQNAYTNNLVTPQQSVSSYTTVDAHLGVRVGDQKALGWAGPFRFGIDVTNLLDRDPPFVKVAISPNGGGGYDPTLTNPVGRTVSVYATKAF